jgi:TRAP-type mannitol/chloroaromatic compound transport system permease small subunit
MLAARDRRRETAYGAATYSRSIAMQALWAFSRQVDRLNRRVGRAAAWCVLASVLVSTANALARKGLGLGSNAWVEMQWVLFAAAFLFSAGYVLLVDEHVRVDALAQRFPPRLRAALDALVLLLFVLPLCAGMVWVGAVYFWLAYATGEGSYMADGLAVWPVRLFIPVGFALLGLQVLSEIIKRAGVLRGGHAGVERH